MAKKTKMYRTGQEKQRAERYGTIRVMDSIEASKRSMPYIPVSAAGCGAHKTDKNPSRARRKAMERREYGY